MTNKLRAIGAVAFIALAISGSSVVFAQGPAADYYSDGVVEFFNGRSCQAETSLSLAIEADSHDPRAYYFRAFSLLRQGRINEARGDMIVGAALEAQQPRRFAIGSALERVQGPDRLMLETFRREARRNAVTQASATVPASAAPQNRTYRERDAEVLREERYVPIDELLRPGAPQAVVAEPAREMPATPPQPAAAPAVTGAPAEQPPADSAPAASNPFGDDPAGSATEPAATPATPPQDTTPPETPATPAEPATTPAEAEDNPFG